MKQLLSLLSLLFLFSFSCHKEESPPELPGNNGGTPAPGPQLSADVSLIFGDKAGTLYCYKETGILVWKLAGTAIMDSHPVMNDSLVFLGGRNSTVYAVRKGNGTIRWQARSNSFFTNSFVLAGSRLITVNSIGVIECFDAASGTKIWTKSPNGGLGGSNPLHLNGTVYCVSGKTLFALDPATGAERWQYTSANNIHSSPASDGHAVIFLAEFDKKLTAFRAGDGTKIWQVNLPLAPHWTSPVVDSLLYIGNGGPLLAFNKATGAVVGTSPYNLLSSSAYVVASGFLYSGTDRVNAFDLTDRKFWFQANLTTPAVFSDGKIYYGTKTGVAIHNAETQTQMAEISVGQEVLTIPLVVSSKTVFHNVETGMKN